MEELEIGSVSGVFGVQGEVRLHLHHRDSSLLNSGAAVVLVDPTGRRFRAELSARPGAGGRVLGRFKQAISREQAETLKGWTVRVPVGDLPPLDDGEFWVWQVIGGDVIIDDQVVGEVEEVHHTGPIDVFEVRCPGVVEPFFVPATHEHVIDVAPGRLVLRALE